MQVLVGIPTYEEAATIVDVLVAADAGLTQLRRDRPGLDARIVVVDSGSGDGTSERVSAAELSVPVSVRIDPGRPRGKGRNVATLLSEAAAADTDALVLLDADVTSITPDWVVALASPVLDGSCAYVSPVYRASQGGPLRHLISRPFTYGCFDADIPQPTGGEVALDGAFCRELAAGAADWPDCVLGYGVDIHLAIEAAATGRLFGVADLGAKNHRARPWSSITPIAVQVAEAALRQIQRHREVVTQVREVRSPVTPVPDPAPGGPLDPAVADVNALRTVADEVTADQWLEAVESAVAAALRSDPTPPLAAALMPSFLGRMITFAAGLADPARTAERLIAGLAALRSWRRESP